MLYLATPYSHESPETRRERYLKACRITAVLMKAGVPVFSPLLNSVPAAEFGGCDLSHEKWLAVDLPILRRSDEVLIVGIEGWNKSEGVRLEMTEAFVHKIPVTLIKEKHIEMLPKIPKSAWHFMKTKIFEESAEGGFDGASAPCDNPRNGRFAPDFAHSKEGFHHKHGI
ncbi:MAG TPA: hypothetical protein DEB39_16005 [Planctomycetaceae bacterium]|nr:hypothetical protein [Planctomycetaceae bacterium]